MLTQVLRPDHAGAEADVATLSTISENSMPGAVRWKSAGSVGRILLSSAFGTSLMLFKVKSVT